MLGRLLPLNGGLSSSGDEGSQLSQWGLNGGVTGGEQVSDLFVDAYGVRAERSRFQDGTIVTARVRVDYDLTLERKELPAEGGEKSLKVAQVPGAATGEAYLTMFKHEYDAMLARLDRGDTLAAAWSHATGTARSTRSLSVSADPVAPSRVLTDALHQARQDQVEVLLTVTEADGRKRSYLALPDGTLHGDAADEGFAEAFATLHPTLVALADRHRIDLRALYDVSAASRTFSAAVMAALRAQGISVEVHPPPAFPAAASTGSGNGAAGTVQAGAGGVGGSTGGP
ncbi:hypothetical protein Kfla_0767 [Kribbella flavida DSM 17836]|uniref:Uncharacterized protein n=1 Tax=Kribbella flavida (strain DSM 17836 / JCM 10339 / NBRC 14399) TaxID=479435 RepID=D2PYP0_KRIFD|nr:hypothetical protein [Kribbella flavida]ADB29886.1 hypothetical protein Kfla_0767 [Kribbella flavida DSM 17836]